MSNNAGDQPWFPGFRRKSPYKMIVRSTRGDGCNIV